MRNLITLSIVLYILNPPPPIKKAQSQPPIKTKVIDMDLDPGNLVRSVLRKL